MPILSFDTIVEIQALSNFAHLVEGIIFGLVAIIALTQAWGYFRNGWKQYVWPGLIIFAGLFLFLFLVFHHGLDNVGITWNFILTYPQQQQHLAISILLIIAGVSEILFMTGFSKNFLLKLIWPAALIIIGLLFLIHPQHGTDVAVRLATTIHNFLGTILILTGILRGIDVGSKLSHIRWFSFLWIILLFIVAILLMIYREPEGAYREIPSHYYDISH